MSTLFVVVPLALVVSAAAVAAFVWSVRRGQLDDLETPAMRMLEEDGPHSGPTARDEKGKASGPEADGKAHG